MSTLKTYPRIYWKDKNGKHPLRFIKVMGRTYEFRYDQGDIVLAKVNNSDV